eukprot:TRINITY_DN13936_c0_g1_i5.p2 TRINITY_DN13936_c0_g1~~TRINITY_DN13936_c0_g1_i5.p2  ORF type:complete len:286 (+),score=65.19 TRINITY_DN13936_c0_g1_i5:719-1576(+)
MTKRLAAVIVCFELWTWMEGGPKATVTGSEAQAAGDIAIVNASAGAAPFWPEHAPFTPADLFPGAVDDMGRQHGGDEYHTLAALAIGWYLWGDWAAAAPRAVADVELAPLPESMCYGTYGMHFGKIAAADELAGANDPSRSGANSKDAVISRPPLTVLEPAVDGFMYGDPFNRSSLKMKRSFYASKAGATFSFRTPARAAGCRNVRLAFVHHSHAEDGAVFSVLFGNDTVLTAHTFFNPQEHRYHVQAYTAVLDADPDATITVRSDSIEPDAYVEITGVFWMDCA